MTKRGTLDTVGRTGQRAFETTAAVPSATWTTLRETQSWRLKRMVASAALFAVPLFTWVPAAAAVVYECSIEQEQPRAKLREQREEREKRIDKRQKQIEKAHEQLLEQLPAEATERFEKTLTVGKTGTLDLANVSGNIDVRGGSGNEVKISALKRVRAMDQEEAKRNLQLIGIDITTGGGRIEVRTRAPHPYFDRQRARKVPKVLSWVDYTVVVPYGAAVTLESVTGDLRLSHVKGEARLKSVNGNMVLVQLARLALAKSLSGNIEISLANAEGDLAASSVSGKVIGKGLKARALDIGTVSGTLTLHDVICQRANIRSVTGNMQFGGALTSGGHYEFISHSGNIAVALPTSSSFHLEATSFNGQIKSDFPLIMESSGADQHPSGLHRSLRGTYGDGGAFVKISVFSGDVMILKR